MLHEHINKVNVTAWFSKDRRYRYRLEISLKSKLLGGKTACVIMLNPSYAGEECADKSVQFMEKVVFEKGLIEFRGVQRLIVVNLFAFIQTNKFEGTAEEIGSENNQAIKDALQESGIIIIGWGSANRFKERRDEVLGWIKALKDKQLFKTKAHPSRAGYAGFIQSML